MCKQQLQVTTYVILVKDGKGNAVLKGVNDGGVSVDAIHKGNLLVRLDYRVHGAARELQPARE